MPAAVTLHKQREKSLTKRHPWIFRSAINKVQGNPEKGATVDVYCASGTWQGRAAYSPESQIALRVWTFDFDENIDAAFFRRRLYQALKLREQLAQQMHSNAYRIVAAEADGLPGLIVDRYDNIVVCQFGSAGVNHWKSCIIDQLCHLIPGAQVFERSDIDARNKEGLEKQRGPLRGEDWPSVIEINEHDQKFVVDYHNGHKTGFYLDQRYNRQIAKRFAKNANVLNCYCYTGAFSVHALAGGAKSVTNVDSSQKALDTALKNVQINHHDLSRVEFVRSDVPRLLRQFKAEDRRFDLVILDPPKFVDAKSHIDKATRAYKDVNRLAMQLVNPGGILMTFSCSGLMTTSLFEKAIAFAALDSGRKLRVIERLHQDSDHPSTPSFPESYYLKGLACYIE